MNYESHAYTVLMVLCGLASHFLKDLVRIQKESGKAPNAVKYFTHNPYHSLLCFIGSVVGYVVLVEMDELSSVTAFMAGYMSNSIADMIGKRAEKSRE